VIRLLARTFAVLFVLAALGCAVLTVALLLTVWGIPAALATALIAWMLGAAAGACWNVRL